MKPSTTDTHDERGDKTMRPGKKYQRISSDTRIYPAWGVSDYFIPHSIDTQQDTATGEAMLSGYYVNPIEFVDVSLSTWLELGPTNEEEA